MDITIFIFLSIIAFFLMFYGWTYDGINFVFLILSSVIFIMLSNSAFDITWSSPEIYNSTISTYTIHYASPECAQLYNIFSVSAFLLTIGKVAVFAQSNLDIKIPSIWKKLMR